MRSRPARKRGKNSCCDASPRPESVPAHRWVEHTPHPVLSLRRHSRENPEVRDPFEAVRHWREDWRRCDVSQKAQVPAVLVSECRWRRITPQVCSCATSLRGFSDASHSWLGQTRELDALATSPRLCVRQPASGQSILSGTEVRSWASADVWYRRLSGRAVAGNESPGCSAPERKPFSDASRWGLRLRRNTACDRIRSAALPIPRAEYGRRWLDSRSCNR